MWKLRLSVADSFVDFEIPMTLLPQSARRVENGKVCIRGMMRDARP